ncbi:MAG: S8 family serine peptidase [Mastigocoleus sp. MO_167.B18]|nr:S8 family serine peptidase [Mastigocoleus sp. MO_167.B18]
MAVEISNPFDINLGTDNVIITDAVSSLEGSDFYKFTIGASSSFNLYLDDLSADADVTLVQDRNSNLQIDGDELIAYSNRGGARSESINEILEEGDYYIQVYPYEEDADIRYRLTVGAELLDLGGDSLTEAYKLENRATISDRIGGLDLNDYYQFTLDGRSDIDITVSSLNNNRDSDSDIDIDIDVQLLDINGDIVSSSMNLGSDESIFETLEAGKYYIYIYPYSVNETDYNLTFSSLPNTNLPLPTSSSPLALPTAGGDSNVAVSLIPQSANSNTHHIQGTLGADTFTYQSGYNLNIFSGNGNYNYSSGLFDTLNLSNYVSNTVGINLANNGNGGVVYNPGDGARVFDAIKFSDGRQILFENIEVVQFADTTLNLSVIPNDPLFNQQWNLHMTGVHNAWRFTQGNNNVLMGVVDTGLGTDSNGNLHPDLRDTIVVGNNYLDEWQGFSHGTPVQGTMGAATNNGQGIAGINWNSSIYTIDVVGGDSGDYNLVGAIDTIIKEANSLGQVAVVNLSLVGGYSVQLEQIIANNQNNALFVIAAGNDGGNSIASPANLAAQYSNVMAIGASWGAADWYGNPKTAGQRVDYSGIGWWGSNYGEGLTLMAPSEFLSTNAIIEGSNSFHTHGYDPRFNGTSASTAMVSGIASLLWSVNQNLTADQIKSILSQTATDLGAIGYDTEYGHGLINADAAVRRAMAISRGFS